MPEQKTIMEQFDEIEIGKRCYTKLTFPELNLLKEFIVHAIEQAFEETRLRKKEIPDQTWNLDDSEKYDVGFNFAIFIIEENQRNYLDKLK